MAAEIYVISGFLGAGKTTLIQKLLKETFQKEKIILIENDFGEISVDAALLKSGSVEVKEINSGCICCSLSGDFIKALKEVLDRFHPDKIVIEPSGVGKLSDVVKSCSDIRIQPLAKVKSKITIVDVKRCKMYLDNFGEFFEDQIKSADIVLLSHAEDFPGKVDAAKELINNLNPRSVIVSKPWNQIDATELIYPGYNSGMITDDCTHNREPGHPGVHTHGISNNVHTHESCNSIHTYENYDNGHTYENHDSGHACGNSNNIHSQGIRGYVHHNNSGHNHSAEAIFDTVTIRTKQIFSIEDLKKRALAMEQLSKGVVLRAKGIVLSTNGYINLQYLPGDIQITTCAADGNMLCFIGQNLNRQELCTLFNGE